MRIFIAITHEFLRFLNARTGRKWDSLSEISLFLTSSSFGVGTRRFVMTCGVP